MSDQFAGGGGGGELPYEATGGIDSHGTINKYRKYPDQYVDRVIATYENDSDDATEIEVAFAVPEGVEIGEWHGWDGLPDESENTG